jgi:hypothetical protein
MSNKPESLHNGIKIGEIFLDEETLILDFHNMQYQLDQSFIDVITEHAEVTIDKGKYR